MKKRYLFVCFILFLLIVGSVNAVEINSKTKGYLSYGDIYCYNNTTGAYTETTSSTTYCSSHNTYFKKLRIVDQDNNSTTKTAYCVQASIDFPRENNASYHYVDYNQTVAGQAWTKKKAYVAAQVIQVINGLNISDEKKYVYTFSALNRYLSFNSSKDFSSGDKIKEYIEQAQKNYTDRSVTSKKMNALTVTTSTFTKNGDYYTGYVDININYNGVTSKAVGGEEYKTATYKFTFGNECKVYLNSSMTSAFDGDITVSAGKTRKVRLWVKINSDDIIAGADNTIAEIVGTANVNRPIARLWDYDYEDTKGQQQMLLTVGTETTTLTEVDGIVIYAEPVYPQDENELPSKTLVVKKVDEYGSLLKGANIGVSFAGKTCSITADKNTCSISVDNVTDTELEYQIVENSAPEGYLKISNFNAKVQFGTTKDICYALEKANADNESDLELWKETVLEDCNVNYISKDVCVDDNGDIVSMNSEGGCGSVSIPENQETLPEYKIENRCFVGEDSASLTADDLATDQNKCSYVYSSVHVNGNVVQVAIENTLNSVKFSKRNESDEDISDAKLKVCDATSYKANGTKCEAYTTVDETKVEWYSGKGATTFNGFKAGDYYLIEENSAAGYILNATPVLFNVSGDGVVTYKSGPGSLEDGTVVFKNSPTKLSISKQDMVTSKEIPGAKLSICLTDNDNSLLEDTAGNCVVAELANGEDATWISTEKVHQVVGLAAGTYYLVEELAPNGYSTAEAIMFTLKEDGTLVDKDGNSLKEQKIVMYDKRIEEVKTGQLSLYIVIGMLAGVVVLGGGTYYYITHKNSVVTSKSTVKIRKRRIHKKN